MIAFNREVYLDRYCFKCTLTICLNMRTPQYICMLMMLKHIERSEKTMTKKFCKKDLDAALKHGEIKNPN